VARQLTTRQRAGIVFAASATTLDADIIGSILPLNGGRWLVRCYCNNISVVSPSWPYHWCLVCGNVESGQAAISVAFPLERQAIEAALLARPLQLSKNADPMMASADAYPLIPGLRRDWYPEQTLDFLLELNKANGLP
jgi:hypothetical protein